VNEADLQRAVLAALGEVAPETEGITIDPAENLREQLDLDSMDFLNFIIAIEHALGVTIPEADYRRVATLKDLTAYVAARLPRQAVT
jgi:acyl carrier protein